MRDMNPNRMLVVIVIALAALLGVTAVSSLSYREGYSDGVARAPQVIYAPDDAPRAAPAPQVVYAQPDAGRPWGWGFNPIGMCLNFLLIGGLLFVVSRLFFRRRFGRGWGHGPGDWCGPRGEWKRSESAKPNERRNPREGDVI